MGKKNKLLGETLTCRAVSTRAGRTVGLVGFSGGRALEAPAPHCRVPALDGRHHRGRPWRSPQAGAPRVARAGAWGVGLDEWWSPVSRRGRAAVALPAGDDHGRSCAVEPGNGRGEETARGDTGGGGLGGDAQTRSEGCGLQRRKTRPGVWIGLGLRSAKKIFGPNQRVVPGLPGLPAGSATVCKMPSILSSWQGKIS